MDQWKKERLIARISSGVRYTKDHEIPAASPATIYRASIMYEEVYNECVAEGTPTSTEMLDILIKKRIWSDSMESDLKKLRSDTENFKIALYENRDNEATCNKIRNLLAAANKEMMRLFSIKHGYDAYTAESIAMAAKSRETIRLIIDDDLSSKEVDEIIVELNESAISDSEFRELARSEPWATTWGCRSSCSSLFGVAATALTDEQKSLISWSTLYESIRDHPERPSDEVIGDDDMLDGWLLINRRKREREQNEQSALPTNSKIAHADEVFLFAQNEDKAKQIHDLNGPVALGIKSQRDNVIHQMGKTNEGELPDRLQQLNMVIANMQRG